MQRPPSPTERRPVSIARQRGAALLLAMVAVTMVATLAAGMVWQQWRAVQVEAAERSRTQSSWILIGALDWSRLILKEDRRTGSIDHLGEPWATPLAEARLSTFLAADRDNNADGGPEAFLSGAIADAQARYNLRNLVGEDGKVVPAEVAIFSRLCTSAGLGPDTARALATELARSWSPRGAQASAPDANRPLAVRRFEQLAWVGLDARSMAALRPLVDLLPAATPINVNTASREVIAAVLEIDLGTAERLALTRQKTPFDSVEKLKAQLPETVTVDPKRVAVASSYFEVSGRLRLEERVLEERSLLWRKGTGSQTEVVTLSREKRSLQAGG
jgi:general secretion pathway protein K